MGAHSKLDNVQRVMDELDMAGLEILPDERVALSAADSTGTLMSLLGLIRRAMVVGSVPGQMARTRQQVRRGRDEADDITDITDRPQSWQVIEHNGTWAFHHAGCDQSYGVYDGPYQATVAASDHHRTCTTGRNR